MSSKKVKLEPCPCCGGEPVRNGGKLGNVIYCKKCGLATRCYKRMSDATRAWNRRVKPAKPCCKQKPCCKK